MQRFAPGWIARALASSASGRRSRSAGLAALEPPPPGSATLPELLRRDQSHRGEIALLRARVRELESTATSGAAPEAAAALTHRDGKRKILDLSADEVADMAKNCEIRFDIPGYGIEPRFMTDKLAEADHLSTDDRAIYDRTVRKENERYMTALRGLYRELTGGDLGQARAARRARRPPLTVWRGPSSARLLPQKCRPRPRACR